VRTVAKGGCLSASKHGLARIEPSGTAKNPRSESLLFAAASERPRRFTASSKAKSYRVSSHAFDTSFFRDVKDRTLGESSATLNLRDYGRVVRHPHTIDGEDRKRCATDLMSGISATLERFSVVASVRRPRLQRIRACLPLHIAARDLAISLWV